jgi:hypothetical protein
VSDYEHQSRHSPRSGWWTVVPICACLAAWGLIQYVTIRDAPRQWDFGALPDAPGQSIYSSSRPAQPKVAPPQMQPLPEAQTQPARTGPSSGTKQAPQVPPAAAQSRPASDGTGGRP